MIKINLLTEKKKQTKAASSPSVNLEGLGNSRNSVLIAVLMLGVLASGGWWWKLDSSIADWQVKLEDADKELKRLEAAIKKSEEYEAQKALLTQKINLITDLKSQQEVPVHILDQVSRSLPDFLWLEALGANNNKITINGKATTYAAVSNFYSNLSESGYFEGVELGRTFEVPAGVSFSLSCSFSSQKITETANKQS